MITRKQYMNKEATHQEYYGQFGKHITGLVGSYIGVDKIKASTDEHFNDIPLANWDDLVPSIRRAVGINISKANDRGGISLSDCVCAAKAAARIIKEGK